jgi:hypothetical protein
MKKAGLRPLIEAEGAAQGEKNGRHGLSLAASPAPRDAPPRDMKQGSRGRGRGCWLSLTTASPETTESKQAESATHLFGFGFGFGFGLGLGLGLGLKKGSG